MNWGRIKTIFIGLLLLANIFLCVSAAYMHYDKVVIQPEMIKKTVAIMQNNGISVQGDIIPKKKLKESHLVTVASAEGDEKIADKLLILESGQTYTKEGDMYISKSGRLLLKGGSTVSFEGYLPSKSPLDAAKTLMSALDNRLSEYRLSDERENDREDIYVFTQSIDGNEVQGVELRIAVSKGDNWVTAEGTFIYAPIKPIGGTADYTDPLNVILKGLDIQGNINSIIEMTPCFITERTMNSTVLVPGYRLTDEYGQHYFFDAVTGEPLK